MSEDQDLSEFLGETGRRMILLSQDSTSHNVHAHRRNLFLNSTGRLLVETAEFVFAQGKAGMLTEEEVRVIVGPTIDLAKTFADCGSQHLLSKTRS